MNKGKRWITAVAAAAVMGVVPVLSADTQEERIARLEAQLAAMQAELAALKSQAAASPEPSSADEHAIAEAVDRAVQTRMAQQPAIPEWVSNITLYGDFRYRHEWADDATKSDDRNRHRIQTRIGLTGKVNEEVDYGFRLASGNAAEPLKEGSPTSNNQDLGNAFSSKNIWLDLAYFDYHPAAATGLNVLGGKIKNPYYRVGNSDLMFDNDVTPEGIAVSYQTDLAKSVKVFGSAGGFYVRERKTDADTSLWGIQSGTTLMLDEQAKTRLTVGAGYYNYGNVKGQTGLGSDSTEFYGNRSSTDGRYISDFDLVQGFAEIGLSAGPLPLRFFGDYMCNTAAAGEDTAYLVGVSLGKTTTPGTWSLSYNYRDVEADALLGVLAEATFAGGGTNIRGHKISAAYQVAKNTQFGVSYMPAKRTRNNVTKDYDVVTVDFTFKF